MRLTPSQSQIAKSKARFRILNCGRRFGKTILAIEEMVGVAIKKKDRRVAYFAPTRDDAREITWNLLLSKCEKIITYKNESLLQIKIMTLDGGESQIALYGWESVQERGKGRGLANDFIVCDEVAQYRNFWLGWNDVLSPTLIDRKGSAMFISTPKGFNHFYDLFNMQVKDKNYQSFHFTTYDNPHIPIEELEREKLSKPEDSFAQEYMADFRKQEGLVYKEFDRDLHVYTGEPTKGIKDYVGAVDFGFRNPCAVLHAKIDSDGHFWITEEWYKTERVEEQIGDYVKSCKFNYVYPDPENASAIEVLNRKGINVREVTKGKGSVESGISAVRNKFKQNTIHIHESCINLISELETYTYKEKTPNSNEPEQPVKEHDHAVDALRYLITTHLIDTDEEGEKAERLISRLRNLTPQTR